MSAVRSWPFESPKQAVVPGVFAILAQVPSVGAHRFCGPSFDTPYYCGKNGNIVALKSLEDAMYFAGVLNAAERDEYRWRMLHHYLDQRRNARKGLATERFPSHKAMARYTAVPYAGTETVTPRGLHDALIAAYILDDDLADIEQRIGLASSIDMPVEMPVEPSMAA